MPSIAPDHCPSNRDEIAEIYCMDQLTPEDAIAFEDHWITCSGCATAVEKADAHVHALREAGKRFKGATTNCGQVPSKEGGA